MISPTSPDFPGHWATCRAGDATPLGAIQAPDKFTSFVCMWPEKDFVLGRGAADITSRGLDAWFPYGGSEWSAAGSKFRFKLLVDDGKNPGLYSWVKVSQLKELTELKPVEVNGLSPMVVNNILGKGSVHYLTAWTCESGRELSHSKEATLTSLVLCERTIQLSTDNGWREIVIHEPLRIPENTLKNECLEKITQRFVNDSEKPKMMSVKLEYKNQEGQCWRPDEDEQCEIPTVIKSENVIRKLAESDHSLGRALYGTTSQSIGISDAELIRSYEVPARTEMNVTLSVYKQTYELHCSALEHFYSKGGKLLLKRLINGRWRGSTCTDVKVEITEKTIKDLK